MLTPEWTKSTFSFSNGNCAEAAWRTSSASYGGGNCAEAGYGAGVIAVRDTKEAHLGEARTVLEFTPGQWRGLLADITTGRIG